MIGEGRLIEVPFAQERAYLETPLINDQFLALRENVGQVRDRAMAVDLAFRNRFKCFETGVSDRCALRSVT